MFFLRKKRALPQSLIIESPRLEDARYEEVFGAAIRDFGDQPSFDWRSWNVLDENQAYGDCVSFSRCNAAEVVAKREGVLDDIGQELNFADLWLAFNSGTTMAGNSLNAVDEYARVKGVVLERYCPYTRNWSERQAIVQAVSPSVRRYLLGNHSWVTPDLNVLKDALASSPLQIGIGVGESWYLPDPIPPYKTISTYHAITLLYIAGDGKKFIKDHYDRQMKWLREDYPVLFAKSFRDLPQNWKTINVGIDKIIARLKGKIIIRAEVEAGGHGEAYRLTVDAKNIPHLVKITFEISDRQLFEDVQKTLREKKVFVGVTEQVFADMSARVAELSGEKVGAESARIDLSELVRQSTHKGLYPY